MTHKRCKCSGCLGYGYEPLSAGRQALGLRLDGYVPAHRSACVSARRRELLKTKNVTQSCPEPPFILREPQDERRVEGDDTPACR